MATIIKFILGIVAATCLAEGLISAIKPTFGIEIQRRWAQRINWKMEPIDMKLELRNTRAMGIFLIIGSAILFALTVLVRM